MLLGSIWVILVGEESMCVLMDFVCMQVILVSWGDLCVNISVMSIDIHFGVSLCELKKD